MKYITVRLILCISVLTFSTAVRKIFLHKRFLLESDQHNVANCESDILKTHYNDVIIRSSSELYHGDAVHDFSASRGLIDSKEYSSSDGVTHMGSWSAHFNDTNQFIEIKMKKSFNLTGIVTQGRNGCCQEWVVAYRIIYSHDCNRFFVLHSKSGASLFTGNSDENTKVTNTFDKPYVVKCLRINPLNYHKHISMRFGLIGHPVQRDSSCSQQSSASSSSPLISTTTTTTAPIPARTTLNTMQGTGQCQSSPCINNGICRNTQNSYQCFCPSSDNDRIIYSGKQCQIVLDPSKIGIDSTTLPTTMITGWVHIPGR
ncbi:discoidin, CUB and LCCL domain-containing protein 2-like [Mytilus edulis]|uniref:discoidin, CUB and LCCL domain-containing protein 2-like n=1 Tax=Mytilus edulis TaxID=6550 RepID=UPI0039F111A4